MTGPQPPLISQHPSTSGLQIALHPLALLTISDYITRHTLRNLPGAIVGALLGSQSGREIAIEHAYEVVTEPSSTNVVIDKVWFETKLRLFKETHPTADLLGWFTTTSSPEFAPIQTHVAVHQELLQYNESLILLVLNPSPAAALSGGGKLPVAIYESIYEADETEANKLGLKFVPLNYTIESGEAEMIGMDFVAKGAGNASSVPNTASATPQPESTTTTTTTTKDTKGKEKEKETEKPTKPEGGVGEKTLDSTTTTKVDVGTQNDELISNLTAKKNAITMLNSRIKLLLSYLQEPPNGATNHQILREIQSLTHSRLPLLKPANSRAFEQEKLAEECDVNLVVLLGAVTRSIEEVRGVGRKSAGIDHILKSAKGKGGGGPTFEDAMDFAGMGGPPGSGGRRLRGMFGF
ncbi:hypothetical protein K440DRAFT_656460 [Wilcoxina mikolae CBS 423.85]|nr:hypothetical protein K440DRAFT_656460 [Wilcoxina mikolae CBS 423.85]